MWASFERGHDRPRGRGRAQRDPSRQAMVRCVRRGRRSCHSSSFLIDGDLLKATDASRDPQWRTYFFCFVFPRGHDRPSLITASRDCSLFVPTGGNRWGTIRESTRCRVHPCSVGSPLRGTKKGLQRVKPTTPNAPLALRLTATRAN